MPLNLSHSQSNPPAGRTKYLLIAGFAATLSISIILAVAGLSFTHTNLSRINEIVETNNVKTMLLREMHSAARERSLLLHMMLDVTDPFERDDLFLQFSHYGARFATARMKLTDMHLSEAEQTLLARQGAVSGIAVPIQRSIVDLIQQEKPAQAQTLLLSRAVPLQNDVLALLDSLQGLQEEASRVNAAQAHTDLDGLILRTFILVAFGALIGILIAVLVIRRITRTETQLQHEKRLAEVTLRSVGEAVITTNLQGHIEYINPMAEALTGWSLAEARQRPLGEVWRIHLQDSDEIPANPILAAIEGKTIITATQNANLDCRTHNLYAVEYTAAPIRDEHGSVHGGILIFRDVTEVRTLASQLSYQASHDTLTGLVNRREFEIRLRQALDNARSENSHSVLCYLDLDQFKVINDTCGHAAGDELLKQIAGELKRVLRDSDTLSRLGGDEFGVLLEGCTLDKARDIAEKLRETIRRIRFAWSDKQFDTGVSIGVVPVSAASGNLADLLSAADSACYEAKDQGRNRVHVFDPKDANIQRRQGEMHWVHRITEALEQKNLVLYGQPIRPVRATSSSDARYEILVRLIDETGNIIPPNAFLPAAERYNLMTVLDRFVIEEAIRMLADVNKWRRRISFNVNVSGQSLNDESFLDFMRDVLHKYDFEPANLTLEITETAAVTNFSNASRLVTALKEYGCQFALDDFGSGLSSFAYLKNLPVDIIKIDGSFVRDILDDQTDRAFVRSIAQIASIMGLRTVAEYVEDARIAARLQELGIDYMQGHYVGIPVPLAAVLAGMIDLPPASAQLS